MAHSRIWEPENNSCYYERGQLDNMILAWEPHYNQHSTSDFDFALGIYTENYFKKTRYGRMPYTGTSDECSISLLELRSYGTVESFARRENGRLNIYYGFVKKLWVGDGQLNRMFAIDEHLIKAKISEFDRLPHTRYAWPLSFSINTDVAKEILDSNGVNINLPSLHASINRY